MERIRAGNAQFPLPFPQKLEYNAPVHGAWNIVHISMLVPEAHSIYVCADNCMRGVVMTAAEMGCQERFSCVMLSEKDVMTDNLETITIEGASDVIDHLNPHPPVIFLFLVCLHIFVSSDEAYILRKLQERYPDICFVRCYMDCVRQKTGPTPDMKLRRSIFEPLLPGPKTPGQVNVLGCDVPYAPESELIRTLKSQGLSVMQLQDCRTYQEYQSLAGARLNICTYMNAQDGVSRLSERMESGYLYLPPAVDYGQIRAEYRALEDALRVFLPEVHAVPEAWFMQQEALCEEALLHLKERLGNGGVSIDYTCHQRPLGIAKLLLTHGIRVQRIYLDAVLDEEQDMLEWLRENAPSLEMTATMRPQSIRREAEGDCILALGQKAAWFEETGYFVNMIESGGLWGYEGIRALCRLMEEALEAEKPMRDIVPRKGMGWPSLCDVPGGCSV